MRSSKPQRMIPGIIGPVSASGNYTITVEVSGFRPNVVKGLTVLANRSSRQDGFLFCRLARFNRRLK